jgi:hypothetical protein
MNSEEQVIKYKIDNKNKYQNSLSHSNDKESYNITHSQTKTFPIFSNRDLLTEQDTVRKYKLI